MIKLFKNDFCKAKFSGKLGIENIIHNNNVVQFPNETFLQISDLEEDIAFAGNIQVDLVDEFENVVKNLEVEVYFFYTEFSDLNGIRQIAFEFGNVNEDFYNRSLYLKITHTFSLDIWYSNAFNISFYQNEKTTRIDYGNDGDFLQSTRYKLYNNDINSKSENKEYTTLYGRVISERKVITKVYNYKMYCCTNSDFENIDLILGYDIIYFNFKRISDKPSLKKGERLGSSNFFDLDFDTSPTNERLEFDYQIYVGLKLISKYLNTGTYTVNQYNTLSVNGGLNLLFNKNISISPLLKLKVYRDGVLYLTKTFPDFLVTDNSLKVNIQLTNTGIYDVIIDKNLIYSQSEMFLGLKINNLRYNIVDPEFEPLEFDNSQFLTS
ncbi:MAG: hypothetical protein LH615_04120 [Ferruginibacter sp.]|nr:hypothetical protein [Ferruginibacter sp.]